MVQRPQDICVVWRGVNHDTYRSRADGKEGLKGVKDEGDDNVADDNDHDEEVHHEVDTCQPAHHLHVPVHDHKPATRVQVRRPSSIMKMMVNKRSREGAPGAKPSSNLGPHETHTHTITRTMK